MLMHFDSQPIAAWTYLVANIYNMIQVSRKCIVRESVVNNLALD